MEKQQAVQIKAPNLQVALFTINGSAPLCIHRFSRKAAEEIRSKMSLGSTGQKNKGKREAADFDKRYEEAKYVSREGWEGFNASSIRAAMISACRLVGFKMTLAKMSIFVLEDGRDAKEPEISLIRIIGKPRKLEMITRVDNGAPQMTARPIYDEWKSNIRIRFDADMFSIQDISNLLSRVGVQVGIGEGRPDSKNSAGMGWGTFTVSRKEESK